MHAFRLAVVVSLLFCSSAFASVTGSIRGLIHDPQHRPVPGAQVTLRSAASDWSRNIASDNRGEFRFDAVPLGQYHVSVSLAGFAAQQQTLLLTSQRDANLHFSLQLARAEQTVEVSGAAPDVNPEASTPTTVLSRDRIARTPGADQTNSLAVITNYVPGAYVVHDQLHMRGGHQITWLLDGVPVPNTNIASNVGPQFDPKDMDYLEVQRGGFSAEYGDRAYGVFNVVPRSGFERDRQGEVVASLGNFYTTNSQLNFGDHSERLAWYGSLSGNRSSLGLETPTPAVLHNQSAGLSGFGSVIFNRTPADQLRLTTSVRGDHYQVPNDPDQQAAGLHDVEDERDAFTNLSWLHTAAPGVLFTLSPFYHFNRAHYDGAGTQDDRGSNYAGVVVQVGVNRGRHNTHIGLQSLALRDNHFFSLTSEERTIPPGRDIQWASLTAFYAEDQYKPLSWLTFNGGVRLTRFSGGVTENVADPRAGAAIQVPKLRWVVRGFFGRYYQAPPLLTITQSILSSAPFLPLRGERDQQVNFGLTIPLRGWVLDADYFRTNAKNFFDHDALGNSNIFFPLTIARARIKGTEVTLRSPQLARRVSLHLAWSHQFVQGRGGITGGLTNFDSPGGDTGYFFLDHDQRDTLSTGVEARLPWHSWASTNIAYGSGFLNGDGPAHLAPHTTLDLSLGKSFGENWSVGVTALNVANRRYLLDQANTFGGTHWNLTRQVYAQVKYRFRL
jgi:outer membrane receptor protein involved in Fe transport